MRHAIPTQKEPPSLQSMPSLLLHGDMEAGTGWNTISISTSLSPPLFLCFPFSLSLSPASTSLFVGVGDCFFSLVSWEWAFLEVGRLGFCTSHLPSLPAYGGWKDSLLLLPYRRFLDRDSLGQETEWMGQGFGRLWNRAGFQGQGHALLTPSAPTTM